MFIFLWLHIETYFKKKSWQGRGFCLCDLCPDFTWARQLSDNPNIQYDTEDSVIVWVGGDYFLVHSWTTSLDVMNRQCLMTSTKPIPQEPAP